MRKPGDKSVALKVIGDSDGVDLAQGQCGKRLRSETVSRHGEQQEGLALAALRPSPYKIAINGLHEQRKKEYCARSPLVWIAKLGNSGASRSN
ncbi:MAG: hypothetical protein J2P21_26085 [Chloracidobacterium sp.]|nr:hypothetical protein [Chloracidobacterium sp.]